MKALVAFGTKYGSTAKVAEAIAEELRKKSLDVNIVNLKEGNTSNLSQYDLVVIGSSVYLGTWTKEAMSFLKRSDGVLSKRRVAYFACCGDALQPEKIDSAEQRYLKRIADRFSKIEPVSMGLFGGVIDRSKYGFWVRLANSGRMLFNGQRKELKGKGIDLSRPYDFRDWPAIREWAKNLAT
jgi:menaquinone-dependent protoporphyrinogen oxidase